MFVIVHRGTVIGQLTEPSDALACFNTARREERYADAYLAEVLIPGADPRTAIPGELDRAIDEWNAMTERINIHIDKVQNRSRLVAPFRNWKKKLGQRGYLLEQLIPDVEAQPYIWPTIRFPWLFKVKDGDFNSDKIHARAYGKNGNGQASEKDYLGLARRIGAWQRDHDHLYVGGSGGDDDDSYERAFERGVGVSWQRWQELRKRFNGGVA